MSETSTPEHERDRLARGLRAICNALWSHAIAACERQEPGAGAAAARLGELGGFTVFIDAQPNTGLIQARIQVETADSGPVTLTQFEIECLAAKSVQH